MIYSPTMHCPACREPIPERGFSYVFHEIKERFMGSTFIGYEATPTVLALFVCGARVQVETGPE